MSPWYLDELDACSRSEWFDLPFSEDQIVADPVLTKAIVFDLTER